MPDRTGQQLGNYRLLKYGNEDDFVEFYLGIHTQTRSQAILKIAKLDKLPAEQFLAQARKLSQLTHPQIVRILESGQDGATPFLVLNYTSFETLRQIYPRGRRLELPQVIRFVKQIAEVLQYAHDRAILHLDIRPENLLPGPQQSILLNNFSVGSPDAYQQTISNAISYRAPEVLQGQGQPASDEYSLGIVAYEWLSGWPPFSGSNYQEIADQQRNTAPRPLRSLLPGVLPDVDRVIMRTLEKDGRARFDTVMAFAEALEQATTSTFRSLSTPSLGNVPAQPTPQAGRSIPPTVAASLSQAPSTQAAPGSTTLPNLSASSEPEFNTPAHAGMSPDAISLSPASASPSTESPLAQPRINSSASLYSGSQISAPPPPASSISAPPPPAESFQGRKNPYGDLQAPSIQYPVYPSVPPPLQQPIYNYTPAPVIAVPAYVPPPPKPLHFPLTRGAPFLAQIFGMLFYSVVIAVSISSILHAMIGFYSAGSSIYLDRYNNSNGTAIILTFVLALVIVPGCSLFCGVFFGGWRGLLVSLLSLGGGLYAIQFPEPPFWSQTTLPGYVFLAILPLCALIIGGIYSRRKYAAWWKSWFTMVLGVALICVWISVTLAIADGTSPSFDMARVFNITSGSGSSAISAIVTSLGCLSLLILLILSLTTAILEGIIHSIVAASKKKKHQPEQANS